MNKKEFKKKFKISTEEYASSTIMHLSSLAMKHSGDNQMKDVIFSFLQGSCVHYHTKDHENKCIVCGSKIDK